MAELKCGDTFLLPVFDWESDGSLREFDVDGYLPAYTADQEQYMRECVMRSMVRYGDDEEGHPRTVIYRCVPVGEITYDTARAYLALTGDDGGDEA